MRTTNRKQIVKWSSVSTLVAVPLLNAVTHAQYFGPGNGNDRRSRESMTMVGSVTSDPVGKQFVIRADNTWTYRIHALWNHPATLSVGDRVRTYGDWKDGMLLAGSVRILREGEPSEATNYRSRPHSIQGAVTKNSPGNEFVVRARNGWTFPVRATGGEPANLSLGDRVRAYGNWREGALHAGNIRIVYDGSIVTGDSGYRRASLQVSNQRGNQSTSGRTITGSVFADLPGNEFTVRGAAGYTYRVRAMAGEPTTLNSGDHVRAFGTWHSGVLHASNVRIAYQSGVTDSTPANNVAYDYYTPNGSRRMLTGTVTSNPDGERFTMRAGNGYTYAVLALTNEPPGLSTGDRVRVYGEWTDGQILAGNVRVLRHNPNPDNYRAHTLTGVVIDNPSGDRFVLRGDNGYTYRILAVWGEPNQLVTGKRVRTYGDWKDGLLLASNVRVLD